MEIFEIIFSIADQSGVVFIKYFKNLVNSFEIIYHTNVFIFLDAKE